MIFPAALPQILIGLRIALGIAWLVVVAAEMIAVDSGLGYLIIDARNSGKRYDLVVAAIFLIGVIGLALDSCFPAARKTQIGSLGVPPFCLRTKSSCARSDGWSSSPFFTDT